MEVHTSPWWFSLIKLFNKNSSDIVSDTKTAEKQIVKVIESCEQKWEGGKGGKVKESEIQW